MYHFKKKLIRWYVTNEPGPLNLAHFRCAIRTLAKFHAAGLCHKQMLWHTLAQQSDQAAAKKTFEDVEVEGRFFSSQLVETAIFQQEVLKF